MNADYIFIENITNNDFKVKQLRIIVKNKYLFPTERTGNPSTYSLIFIIDKHEFEVKYIIGSKDGKSRSGVLKLDLEFFKINKGTILKITKIESNKYTLERR